MTNIQNHLAHMLRNEQTGLIHLTDDLMAEIAAVNLDARALQCLGRHVLTLVSADLKSGLHAQKAMSTAMRGVHD